MISSSHALQFHVCAQWRSTELPLRSAIWLWCQIAHCVMGPLVPRKILEMLPEMAADMNIEDLQDLIDGVVNELAAAGHNPPCKEPYFCRRDSSLWWETSVVTKMEPVESGLWRVVIYGYHADRWATASKCWRRIAEIHALSQRNGWEQDAAKQLWQLFAEARLQPSIDADSNGSAEK